MKHLPSEWSRRQFITAITGTSAALLSKPFYSWANSDIDPKIAAIVAKTIGIDTHNHIDVPLNTAELPGPQIDLAEQLRQSGLSAICMTFAVDYQKLENPGDAYYRFINGLAAMDAVLNSNKISRSLNLKDIQHFHKKTPTVIQSVEGGHFLEGKIERLDEAYGKGLRMLGLLHDNDASVPLGDIYTKPVQWGGLTSFGTEVIKACNKLGILIDLTHCNNDTINTALKTSTKPIIISHTGLDTQLGQNENMAKMMRPRLISKEQAKIVADAGGVIGVWTHLADTPLAYAQNIRAMVDVVGIDYVCIGTDTKLTPSYQPPRSGNQPSNMPNGGKRQERIGERTNRAWQDQKQGFYYTVVEALLQTGFTEKDIAKIGGGNFCRVFDAATKGH
jgi:membrane dipeptidase